MHVYIHMHISNCLRHDPPPCPNVCTIGVAIVQNRFSASWAVVPLSASSAAGAHSFPRGPYSAYKVNYKMQSKTKRNARQFWKRPEVFLYMFSCLSHCNEKQNGMPDNFEKNDSKMKQILHPLAPFWPTSVPFWRPSATILTQLATSVEKVVFFVENSVFYEGVFHNLAFRSRVRSI